MITVQLIRRLAERPFEYGKCDCFTFTRQLVQAHHGVEFMGEFKYSNEREAKEVIAMGGGMSAMITDVLGEPLELTRSAREGDVAVADLGDGPALGFVLGAGIVIFKTIEEPGMIQIHIADCDDAWRVTRTCLMQ